MIKFEYIDSEKYSDIFDILLDDKKIGELNLCAHGWINKIEIKNKYRNKGLGKQIYKKINDELLLKERNLSTELSLISLEAKRVWLSLEKENKVKKIIGTNKYQFI